MRVLRLYIGDYRVLSQLDMRFDPGLPQEVKGRNYHLDFLVGVNGTGKSTVLRLLGRIYKGIQKSFDELSDLPFIIEYWLESQNKKVRISNIHPEELTPLERYFVTTASGLNEAYETDKPDEPHLIDNVPANLLMDKEKQGGGPLIDLATHALDLTLWMMDNYEPVTALGSTFDRIAKLGSSANIMGPWDPAEFEVEDAAFGLVKFKNGATVMVESSWALNMIVSNEGMTLLCGTKAGADMFPPTGPVVRTSDWQAAPAYYVRVNGEHNGKLYVQNYTMGGTFLADGGKPEQFVGGMKELDVWLKAVRGEDELVVKPEQAYTVTRVLEAIYRSAQAGDVVHMA